MFINAAVRWVPNISLSEQETYAILIMFIDAGLGWVLDVSLFE
jgi:hypothetical protein